MAKVRFFSNSVNVLDHNENEIAVSPKDTRIGIQRNFTVPLHSVKTNNLMVFVNGEICLPDIDYEDIDSQTIRFKYDIGARDDFMAVLIKTAKNTSGGDGVEIIKQEIKWEDF